jgi:hypothetical protein
MCRAILACAAASLSLRIAAAERCVPPCARNFRCDPDRCSENTALGAQQQIAWHWDLSTENTHGASTVLAIDYTINALDESMIAVAAVGTDSLSQVVDKLKRNKHHTGDDAGWLLPDSSCDDLHGSCVDHPATGLFRPASSFPTRLSLVVLCKTKNKNDRPCNLMYAPPSIVLRNEATGSSKRVLPGSVVGAGQQASPWDILASAKKYVPFLTGLPDLPSLADTAKWSMPTFSMPSLSADTSARWAAGARGAAAGGFAWVGEQLPTLTFNREHWQAQLRSSAEAAGVAAWDATLRAGSAAQSAGLRLCTQLESRSLNPKLLSACEFAFAPQHTTIIGVLFVSNGLLFVYFFRRCFFCCCCGCGRASIPDGKDGSLSPPRRSAAQNDDYCTDGEDFRRIGEENANQAVAALVLTPGTNSLLPIESYLPHVFTHSLSGCRIQSVGSQSAPQVTAARRCSERFAQQGGLPCPA